MQSNSLPPKNAIITILIRQTFVLTHGYLEHGKKDWLVKMKDEFLIHGDHNVIIVSWLGGSRST
jgi:hypothetical protein